MKIVLDTNIYIAAALRNGFSADIIDILAEIHDLNTITSKEILTEFKEKLQNKFNWPMEYIDLALSRIRKITQIVEVNEKVSIVTRDPEDNKVLECALAGGADLIITLDQDLIKLKHFQGIGIIHPKTFSWTFPEYFKKNEEN